MVTGSLIDIENLSELIKLIAQNHAQQLKNSSSHGGYYDFDALLARVEVCQLFTGVDVSEQLKSLNKSIERFTKDEPLVKDVGIGKLVHLPYEPLCLIFAQTDEKFRQNHLEYLLNMYFDELMISLELNGSTYKPDKVKFDIVVRYLIIFVKLQTLFHLIDEAVQSPIIEELVENLQNYFNCPRLNQEDIYVTIRNKIKSTNYQLKSYELIPLDARNGHLGDYFKLLITISTPKGNQSLNLFAKFLAIDHPHLQKFIDRGVSKKEDFFYLTFIEKLRKEGFEELTDFAPACYFSRIDDYLIFDDLTAEGFIGLAPNNKLQLSALSEGVKQLAKFHSCTILLEQRLNTSMFDIYNEFLQELLFVDNGESAVMFENLPKNFDFFMKYFKDIKHEHTEEELLENFHKLHKKVFELLGKHSKLRNVICHGDMYVGNQVFKYYNKNECVDVKLIDFQILRYTLPTNDLAFFLHQNALKSTLDAHYLELTDEYYKGMDKCLSKYGLDINKLYPKNEYEESLKLSNAVGLYQSFIYSPMQTIDPKVREEMTRDPKAFEKFAKDPNGIYRIYLKDQYYRDVMRGVVEKVIQACDLIEE